MKALKWKVYHNHNNEITEYNIFTHSGFMSDIESIFSDKFLDKSTLADKIDSALRYYFWARCEAEVVVTSWQPYITYEELDRLVEEKEDRISHSLPRYRLGVELENAIVIDVYGQVTMNWEVFIEYMWKNYQMLGENR